MHRRWADRASARRATIAAAACTGVFAVGAGAVGIFGPSLFEPRFESAAGPSPIEDPIDQTLPPEPPRPVDLASIAELLGQVKNVPVPDQVASIEGEPEVIEPEVDPGEIRFVGSVTSGSGAAAFLSINGATRLVRVGQEREGVRLVSVEPDRAVVERDGARSTLEKAERTGKVVTMIETTTPEGAVEADMPRGSDSGAPEFRPDMSDEERREMMMERARRARDRFERNRRNGEGESPRPPEDRR